MNIDLMNACFELVGCFLVWGNVKALLRDRQVQGVNLTVAAFYVLWGLSNTVYYYHLGHWLSLFGDLGIVSANITWLALALRFRARAS